MFKRYLTAGLLNSSIVHNIFIGESVTHLLINLTKLWRTRQLLSVNVHWITYELQLQLDLQLDIKEYNLHIVTNTLKLEHK